MTSTTTRTSTRTDAAEPTTTPVAPPAKTRRRPWHVATAVALAALGVTIGAVTWSTTSTLTSVLVAKETLHRGDVITTSSFTTARVNDDSALDPVTPAELHDLVGKTVALDVAAGGIVSHAAVADTEQAKPGTVLVGIKVEPGRAPGGEILVGDHVLVVVTPGANDAVKGVPASVEGEVASVNVAKETGDTILDVLVPGADGPTLAAQSANGNVAVVLTPDSSGKDGE